MAKRGYESAYNDALNEEPMDPKEKIRCKAHGCPLAGSQNHGGDAWVCTYHGLAGGDTQWPHITKVINDNLHYQRMLKAVNSLKADEFDKLQERGSWEVHKFIKPAKGETHSHWQHRARQTIHKALKHKVVQAMEEQANRFTSNGEHVSKAVKELTSGALLFKKMSA